MERQNFSYENTYEFSVETNPYNEEENEIIKGDITFSADAIWNESLGEYEVNTFWSETSGRFDNINGDAPDKEDEFREDWLNYLISQGVDIDDMDDIGL